MKYDFDIHVQVIDLHSYSCREAVTKNPDGSYTIFINARQASNIQREAFEHAMKHIRSGDFDKRGENIQRIEAAAHGLAVPAEVKRRRKKLSKYEKYVQKMTKRREALERLGVYEHVELVDDEYGCPVVSLSYR